MKKGMNFVKGFISFSEGCVRLLLFLTVGLLFGMSFFRTSVVSGYEEHTDYLVDSLGSHLGRPGRTCSDNNTVESLSACKKTQNQQSVLQTKS